MHMKKTPKKSWTQRLPQPCLKNQKAQQKNAQNPQQKPCPGKKIK